MNHGNPLLLLDNEGMLNAMGHGEFNCHKLTFEETRVILEAFEPEDVRICFVNDSITEIVFPWLGLNKDSFAYSKVEHTMHVGQEAIVFKFLNMPSVKQQVNNFNGYEGKKVHNVYGYCQYVTRTK